MTALAAAWEFSVEYVAAVAPAASSSDALGAALWAFSTLSANCTLQLLPATPAAAAFAALPLPHAAAEYVIVSAPMRRASGPSIFSQPLGWTAPFRWPLWACVGGSVVLASAAQAALEGGATGAKPRDIATALFGWRFAPPATPAGRLHATAFAFTTALLFAQYVARAAAMAGSTDGGLLAAAPRGAAALCVADVASHAAFAAAALPSLSLTKRSSASSAALLAALRSGECAAALTTAADAAYAAGGPGDAAGANCGLPAPSPLQPVQPLALPLSPTTAAGTVAALGVLLAHAAAPGGAFAEAAAAAFPANGAPHCAGGARWAAASPAAPLPLSLRELSGIFMLQVAAGVAAAVLHLGGAAGRAVARRRHGLGKGADGEEELLEMEVVAAENGSFAHDWNDSDSNGGAAHKPSPSPSPRRGPATPPFMTPPTETAEAHRASPALRTAVQQMQEELSSGDGMGWGAPAPRRASGRGVARAELLAIEADAAKAMMARSAPASDVGPARHRSRTPPRGGAVSADHFVFVPPPRSPRSAGGNGVVRGRPALPRDTGEDFLDMRL